jgi:hypothetical protein
MRKMSALKTIELFKIKLNLLDLEKELNRRATAYLCCLLQNFPHHDDWGPICGPRRRRPICSRHGETRVRLNTDVGSQDETERMPKRSRIPACSFTDFGAVVFRFMEYTDCARNLNIIIIFTPHYHLYF